MVNTVLTEEQIARIKKFKGTLSEVEPSPVELALDNFSKDSQPDSEIKEWEEMASKYQEAINEQNPKSIKEKKAIFSKLLNESLKKSPVKLIKKS